jgi:hypothetical protein
MECSPVVRNRAGSEVGSDILSVFARMYVPRYLESISRVVRERYLESISRVVRERYITLINSHAKQIPTHILPNSSWHLQKIKH